MAGDGSLIIERCRAGARVILRPEIDRPGGVPQIERGTGPEFTTVTIQVGYGIFPVPAADKNSDL